MTKMKEHAAELLLEIPDDKVVHVIEMLKNLISPQSEKPAIAAPAPISAMGVFSKYANPALIPLEKGAWGEVVKEKHAIH